MTMKNYDEDISYIEIDCYVCKKLQRYKGNVPCLECDFKMRNVRLISARNFTWRKMGWMILLQAIPMMIMGHYTGASVQMLCLLWFCWGMVIDSLINWLSIRL